MSGDLLALLDQLDEARVAGTADGVWRAVDNGDTFWPEYRYEILDDEGTVAVCSVDNDATETTGAQRVALIVAAVNAQPKLTAALRAVPAEHRPMANSPGRVPACPDCLGGIYADDPDAARSCGCWGLSTPVCSSCADKQGARLHPMQWPCPTVQAITAALTPEQVQP